MNKNDKSARATMTEFTPKDTSQMLEYIFQYDFPSPKKRGNDNKG